jgi:dTDP-4-amino-4,6-dideoxygalactose transaminase
MPEVAPIPFLDLDRALDPIRDPVEEAVLEVLRDGRYILGPHVAAFEAEWGTYLGNSGADVHVVGVSSGTAALFVALMALEIGPGDEVITTPFSFASPVEAICRLGATPVFVDVDPETYLLDLDQVEAAITSRTRVLLPVHLFGKCVDLERVRGLCDAHGLALVEDAAQAHGAKSSGMVAGTVGDLACFSFYPTKNLGAAGDAGAVVTRSEAMADKVRLIARHGSRRKYHHELLGQNERIDAVQAAVLRVKLPHLAGWNAERRSIAGRYHDALGGQVGLPPDSPGDVYHHMVCRIADRDNVRQTLMERGIGTGIYYPSALHTQPAFRAHMPEVPSLPVVERLTHEVLALPCFPGLRDDELFRVCAELLRV